MDDKIKNTVEQFLKLFEEVFDKDWKYTKEMMGVYEETEEQKRNAKKMGLESPLPPVCNWWYIHANNMYHKYSQ